MRDMFVVLVSLYIRVTTGFIVPPGIPEFINEDNAILAENGDIQSEDMKRFTLGNNIESSVLHFTTKNPKKTLDFTYNKKYDEQGLYENGNTKENNVNERSYIIINHRYKTPMQNQLHFLQSRGENVSLEKTLKLLTPNINKFRVEEFPLKFSTGYTDYNIMSSNEIYDKKEKEMRHPALNKLSQGIVNTEDNIWKTKTQLNEKQANERREYFELLKRPMLRSDVTKSNNRNLKYNYKTINKAEHGYNFINKPPKYVDTSKNLLPHKSTNILKNSFNASEYGYILSDENQQPMFQYNNKFVNKNKYYDADFSHNVILDEIGVPKTTDNSLEEQKQIDRYIVNNTDKQKIYEKFNENIGDCEYDCVAKLRKQYLENEIHSKSQCRCAIERIARERSEREEPYKHKEMISKLETDSNEYEEILADVTNVTKKLNNKFM